MKYVIMMIIMACGAAIVLGRWKMLRGESSANGIPISVREASALKTLACRIPMPPEDAAVKLADGVPAGDLVCTWDEERSAYCFRSELPDGSIPLYCRLEMTPLQEGTQLIFTRQRNLLHGDKDVVLRLSGFLTKKLSADFFTWTVDE